MLRHALATMVGTPAGPVHLSLPQDVLKSTIDAVCEPLDQALYHPATLSLPMAQRALEHIARGRSEGCPRRIAILAGAGVARANGADALVRVSEQWSIPVATTLQAKDVFPEDHPLSLGVFGYAGTCHATQALQIKGLELLIVLGSGLNDRDSMHWTLLRQQDLELINVNADPREIGIHGALGCSAIAGHSLISWWRSRTRFHERFAAGRTEREDWLAKIRAEPQLMRPEDCDSDAIPIHPARAVAALRRALPRDGIVLIDSGAHRAFAGHYWECYRPGTYISATNLGPMGWAIPAAIGVQCARPQARVAVITGDGCMQMHGVEVQTAARYRLPIVYVVINNAALCNVWLRAQQLGPVPDELTRVPDHDWAGFARALGARGETVNDPAELDSAVRAGARLQRDLHRGHKM